MTASCRNLLSCCILVLLFVNSSGAYACGSGMPDTDSQPFHCFCGGFFIRFICDGLDGLCESGKFGECGGNCSYLTARSCSSADLKERPFDLLNLEAQRSMPGTTKRSCSAKKALFESWLAAHSLAKTTPSAIARSYSVGEGGL